MLPVQSHRTYRLRHLHIASFADTVEPSLDKPQIMLIFIHDCAMPVSYLSMKAANVGHTHSHRDLAGAGHCPHPVPGGAGQETAEVSKLI